jgi:hypothetical protein
VGPPERLRTVFPALAERVDAVAAGCRRLEHDLPHLAGVIHRARDVYWLKVSDTFWVVGADVERIRAVAAHGDRHGMIFVADDISGVDQARLAEVLADQLGAMPDPPLAVVLAPPIIDADPSWPELQLSFLRGNTTLRVHPQFAGLGRRVRAHLMGLGGTGPVGSPARRELGRALSELLHQAGTLNWLKVSDRLWVVGTDPGRILEVAVRTGDRDDEAILVADDISGTDPEPLAAALAAQLTAMRARPPFITLHPIRPMMQARGTSCPCRRLTTRSCTYTATYLTWAARCRRISPIPAARRPRARRSEYRSATRR